MSVRKTRSLSPQASFAPWENCDIAPVILIKAGESILGERALEYFQQRIRDENPDIDIVTVNPSTYTRGDLAAYTSPSLFGEKKFIRVRNLENLNSDFQNDMQSYLNAVSPDSVIVAVHGGGNKGMGLLRAIDKAGFPVCTIPKLKYDSEKAELVKYEARQAGRVITTAAVQNLVDALGSDTRELLAALAQLIGDIEGEIDEEAVHIYYAGRKEATGFDVADAAIAGQTGRAIALARHALATGTDPVPIVAACAMKLRTMALVFGARSQGRKLSLASWQIDRAKKELARWNGEGLAQAIAAVAQADADVKGASRDPVFALERAIIRIGKARSVKNSRC